MSTAELPPIDPRIGLAFTAADLLIPVFSNAAVGDAALARQMAFVAIEDYQPATRADYVNLARTIAFSMASLALLGHAASPDMTLTEKMNAFGRANALNRSADQSERTMMQRRRYQQAKPRAEQPDFAAAPLAPSQDADASDAELQASIETAMQEYLASTKPAVETAIPQTTPPAAQASTTSSAPHLESQIERAVAGAQATIRGNQTPQAGSPTRRNQLLQNSALQRGVTAAGLDTESQRLAEAR